MVIVVVLCWMGLEGMGENKWNMGRQTEDADIPEYRTISFINIDRWFLVMQMLSVVAVTIDIIAVHHFIHSSSDFLKINYLICLAILMIILSFLESRILDVTFLCWIKLL